MTNTLIFFLLQNMKKSGDFKTGQFFEMVWKAYNRPVSLEEAFCENMTIIRNIEITMLLQKWIHSIVYSIMGHSTTTWTNGTQFWPPTLNSSGQLWTLYIMPRDLFGITYPPLLVYLVIECPLFNCNLNLRQQHFSWMNNHDS